MSRQWRSLLYAERPSALQDLHSVVLAAPCVGTATIHVEPEPGFETGYTYSTLFGNAQISMMPTFCRRLADDESTATLSSFPN